MARRIMALLMAMVMVFGFGVVSHAEKDEVKVYEGGGNNRVYSSNADWTGEQEVVNATMEISGDYYRLRYKGARDGVQYDIIFQRHDVDWEVNGSDVHLKLMSYNGVDWSNENLINWRLSETEEEIIIMNKISHGHSNGTGLYNDMNIYLTRVDKPTEPSIYEISTPFTGTTISDRDEYTLALAGYFEKELTDGTHELTLEEIKEQTISIVAYNKENGVKRVMTQSTIEEMSVTVTNGVVTEYTIRGRVQTSGGKLDKYTVVIEQ